MQPCQMNFDLYFIDLKEKKKKKKEKKKKTRSGLVLPGPCNPPTRAIRGVEPGWVGFLKTKRYNISEQM